MVVKKQGGKDYPMAMKDPFLSLAKLSIRIERSNTFAFLLKG